MPKLTKSALTTYIPATPGDPGRPATIGHSGYWGTIPVQSCSAIQTVVTADYSTLTGGGGSPVSMVYGYTCTTTQTPVYYPPVASSPGTPYSAPTPEQITVSLNVGWNSYASSVGKLDAGKFLKYTIKSGTTGAFFGVGYAGMEGRGSASFTHGLMADVSTVRVFEGGVSGTVLGAPAAQIRIGRLVSGQIVYAVDSVYYISTAPAYLPSEELYVYGLLYSAYDEISTSEFVTYNLVRESSAKLSGLGSIVAGLEQFVEATISGTGDLIASPFPSAAVTGAGAFGATVEQPIETTISGNGGVWAYAEAFRPISASIASAGSISASPFPTASISGVGAVTARTDNSQLITLNGTGRVTAEAYRGRLSSVVINCVGGVRATSELGGRATGSLLAVRGLGGDTAYAQGYGVLPAFVSGATNGQSDYVPPPITRGYANLPFVVGAAYATEISIGSSTSSLPLFIGFAGDYEYGLGRGDLPKYVSASYGGFIPDNMLVLVSPALATSTLNTQRDIVLILNSIGQIQSTLSLTRTQALELISAAQGTSTLSILGVYGFKLISNARGLSIQTLSVNNRPDLYDNGVVWVLNTSNNASSQYEHFGFNSFFTRAGKDYGVANDGIYLLEGATDNGAAIEALAEMGRSNYGSPQRKSLTNVYLGVGSEDTMYLKVNADDQEYIYEMRNSSPDIANKRVDIGKGLKGNYWNMTLLNKDGADFKLASVVFEPIPLTRKI